MAKTYSAPRLVQYGRIDEITLGGKGTSKDFKLSTLTINGVCDPPDPFPKGGHVCIANGFSV
jgi:hypothetical protein